MKNGKDFLPSTLLILAFCAWMPTLACGGHATGPREILKQIEALEKQLDKVRYVEDFGSIHRHFGGLIEGPLAKDLYDQINSLKNTVRLCPFDRTPQEQLLDYESESDREGRKSSSPLARMYQSTHPELLVAALELLNEIPPHIPTGSRWGRISHVPSVLSFVQTITKPSKPLWATGARDSNMAKAMLAPQIVASATNALREDPTNHKLIGALRNQFGTLLHLAAHCETIRPEDIKLLTRYVSPNCLAANGLTPLALTILLSNSATLDLLLRHVADPNEAHCEGKSLLHCAAFKNRTEIIRILLQHGANPNNIDCRGRTPLYDAVRNGTTEAVEILLQHGARPDIADEEGITPLQLAEESYGEMPTPKELVLIQILRAAQHP